MMRRLKYLCLLTMLAASFIGCTATGDSTADTSVRSANPESAAADYCAQNGGVVETRYPFYDANSADPLQLSGSLTVCTFTAPDDSRIAVGLDTLYTDQPTLAAMAYRAGTQPDPNSSSANPSSLYCTQIGGTDSFGGTSFVVGGWGLEDAADMITMCVFPDLSVIDSWGITYHTNDVIRGADLSDLFRYQP